MSSESITQNDLTKILNGLFPVKYPASLIKATDAGGSESNVQALLDELTEVSYIKAWMSTAQTITAANTHVILNLTNSSLVGSKFSFNSSQHAIVVGAGVNYVHVIASMYVGDHGTNGSKNLYVYHNNSFVARDIKNMTNNYNILKTEAYVAVNEGDTFKLDTYCTGTTTAIAAESYSTFLIVRAIG